MTAHKLLAAIGLLLLAAPVYAHHSFAAEFDAKKCTDFTGTLTGIDCENPHGYFHVDVKDANGSVESWSFQTVSLITLKRSGTTRRDFLDNIPSRGPRRLVSGRWDMRNYRNTSALTTRTSISARH